MFGISGNIRNTTSDVLAGSRVNKQPEALEAQSINGTEEHQGTEGTNCTKGTWTDRLHTDRQLDILVLEAQCTNGNNAHQGTKCTNAPQDTKGSQTSRFAFIGIQNDTETTMNRWIHKQTWIDRSIGGLGYQWN